MGVDVNEKLSMEILTMAREFGADLAGFVDIESLKRSPSHKILSRLPLHPMAESSQGNVASWADQTVKGEIAWPRGFETMLIIAVSHPEKKPTLDYWRTPFPGGTEGNLQLIRINNKMIKWLQENKKIKAEQVPYPIELGGVYLKDAAALAGLGAIGKNNMLVTPRFGPRVRLRAMVLPGKFSSTGPMDYDPCVSCEMPCRTACPRGAFEEKIFSSRDHGQTELPAREGVYARASCALEMSKNREAADVVPMEGKDASMTVISVCRACEFACPAG